MPFDSIEDLRTSEIFDRMDSLKAMSERQLSRFVSVFNKVFDRITRNGGSESQAESTAIAIALPSAKRANIDPSRHMEADIQVVAPMATEQLSRSSREGLSGQVFDFSWIEANPDIANLVVAGNQFNFEHEDGQLDLGRIRALVRRSDLPDTIRSQVDEDVPFVYVASFFDDIPQEMKAKEMVSAEFHSIQAPNGISVPIPTSFAVSDTPLNGPELGIEVVATIELDNEDEVKETLSSLGIGESVKSLASTDYDPRDGMTEDEPEGPTLKEQLADLGLDPEDIENVGELQEELSDLQATVEEVEEFKEEFSSFFGESGDDDPEEVDATELLASFRSLKDDHEELVEEHQSALERIEELETQSERDAAEEFAANLVEDGKIKADETEEWADLYLNDEDFAEKQAERLEANFLGEAEGQGSEGEYDTDEVESSTLQQIDPDMYGDEAEASEAGGEA